MPCTEVERIHLSRDGVRFSSQQEGLKMNETTSDQDWQVSRLLRLREAARVLNVSERTIRRLVSSGDLTAIHVTERGFRFSPADLHDFIQRHRVCGDSVASS